jgi:hypothetical protein
MERSFFSSNLLNSNGRETETEWVEQDDPGVYNTLTTLSDGSRDLKHVRFRGFVNLIFPFLMSFFLHIQNFMCNQHFLLSNVSVQCTCKAIPNTTWTFCLNVVWRNSALIQVNCLLSIGLFSPVDDVMYPAVENLSVKGRQSNCGQTIGQWSMHNIMCVGELTGSTVQQNFIQHSIGRHFLQGTLITSETHRYWSCLVENVWVSWQGQQYNRTSFSIP